jgi:hypothetical protein
MKKIVFILFAGLWLFPSCQDDVLDKEPKNSYTDATIWSSSDLIEAVLAAQYLYTPVMVNDANCSFGGSAASRYSSSIGGAGYAYGNSAEVMGPFSTMVLADESFDTVGAWWEETDAKLHGITSDGGRLEWWENAYFTIRNLNEFIERVGSGDSPIEPELAQTRVAEARFLRAFCYFAMVKRYGGVPLLTTVTQVDSPEELLYPKRNTEKELWDFVLSETEEIAGILPEVPEYGRAGKWAALALKCRAALYAASIARYGTVQLDGLLGIPQGEANSYYQLSMQAAQRIITESQHDLYNEDADKVENFKNIFLKKKNREAIMVKVHDGTGPQSGGGTATWSWDMCCAPRPNTWGIGNNYAPYLEVIEEFEYVDGSSGKFDRNALQQNLWTMKELWKDRDPRFFASIWTNETPWRDAVAGAYQGDTVDFHGGLIKPDGTVITGVQESYEGMLAYGDQYLGGYRGVSTGFGIMKYVDPASNNMIWFMESRTDYQIFRFAEVLLNYAEAAFELGNTGEALTAVNRIRERAGIKALASVDREKIRHERRVELCFENHRYWDVRRWRTAEAELGVPHSGIIYLLDYETRKYKILVTEQIDGMVIPQFPASNYYLPITKARIAQNSNLVENPGYN